MSSTFDSYLQAENANLFTLFGETISYTPAGGALQSISAVVERNGVQRQETDGGHILVTRMTIHIQTSDVATPAVGDKVVVDSTTFAVAEKGPTEAGMVSLQLESVTRSEFHGQGHRGRRS